MKCNISFESKYAKLDSITGTIDINDYLNGKYGFDKILRCVPGNHELVAVNSVQRRVHFRHKHRGDLEGHPMTEWHIEWQSNFPDTEIEFKYQVEQLRSRRADIVIPEHKQIIEIQHSKIESGEVNARIKDYALHNHTVKWIIHGQNCIKIKMFGERRILEFTSNYWLYQSFLDCETVYYDIDGFIYQVKPKLVKSYQIDVSEPKLKCEFIDALKTNTELWDNDDPPQFFLYLKQQGAGSGKTHGMMQMLNSDKDITHYKYIALITKQHSAVKVMLREFDAQYNENKLTNIENLECSMSTSGNQYIRKYKNKLTNIECIAMFGTVDSFTHSLGESPKNAADKFNGIVQSIRDGTIKTGYDGRMRYASTDPILNKEMLIMIDETQDLTETYGEAFLQIVRSKYTNLCVVGDRLQSLSFKENTLTYLHRAEDARMKLIKADTTNIVRRFSDPALVKFVNDLIPFESYDLPRMIAEENSERVPGALTVFTAKTIYADTSEESEDVVNAVEEIMILFKKEVESNNRIPEDFLIVTPTTKKNPLIEALQIALNSYWKDIMENNTEYIRTVKLNSEYWKNVDTNQYRRYAIFHKSEDGCSINTNESINATRMVSIHSSKGDGRKVVFVIGVTQTSLQLFSQIPGNIIYDSLLHVAITRQKEKLFFRLEPNNDDIYRRIKNSETDIIIGNTEFDILKKTIKMSKISDRIQKFSFDDFYKSIISKSEIPHLPDETKNKKLIIDMGDHNIRYSSMSMNIWIHCCNHELQTKSTAKKQFIAILHTVKSAHIQPVKNWQEYYKILKNNRLKDKPIKYIPVLEFSSRANNQDYQIYYKIIIATINRVMKELDSLSKISLNYFCPFESVILYYMIESTQKGKYQAITISDLYNIIDVYSKVFDSSSIGHEHCECNKHFSSNHKQLSDTEKEYKEYLCNHFDRLSHVNRLLDDFDMRHTNINWLYTHLIGIDKKDQFFINSEMKMIGYDGKSIFNIYIKPQFNDLNFNEFLVSSLLDTYLLCNLDNEDNFKRFGNKPVVSYVLSLNKDSIYEINWTDVVRENRTFIQKILYDKLYEMFSSKHPEFYETFLSIINSNKFKDPTSMLQQCQTNFDDKAYPPYLTKAWDDIFNRLEDCDEKEERDDVLRKYTNKDVFIRLFDSKLKRSLKTFLDIEEDD
jgi:hypothetical protein